MEGYVQALTTHGIEVSPDLTIQVLPKEREGYEATQKLLGLPHPPTAIFTGNNLLTIGALKAIQARNLTIPDDVALTGFDEMRWTSLIRPGFDRSLSSQPMSWAEPPQSCYSSALKTLPAQHVR